MQKLSEFNTDADGDHSGFFFLNDPDTVWLRVKKKRRINCVFNTHSCPPYSITVKFSISALKKTIKSDPKYV